MYQVDTILVNNYRTFALENEVEQQNQVDTNKEIQAAEVMNIRSQEDIARDLHNEQMEAPFFCARAACESPLVT